MPKLRIKTDCIEFETEFSNTDNYDAVHGRIIAIIREVSEQHQKIAKSESNQNADK